MTKRKSLSKKIRFEVFKRDSFTCQYCGAKAPQVTLEVDHIDPVSKGGTNEMMNLVTSCFECNRGKSNKKLNDDSIITKQQKQLDEINERRNQLKMLQDWRKELSSLDDEMVKGIAKEFEAASGTNILEAGLKEIKKWVNKYDYDILLDSLEASLLQYEEPEKSFSMIPRIAYYKSNPERQIDPDIFYIRGILRNRLNYIDEQRTISLLVKANEFAETETLKYLALECSSWTQIRDALEDIIENEGI